jgi:hypothetical protein
MWGVSRLAWQMPGEEENKDGSTFEDAKPPPAPLALEPTA